MKTISSAMQALLAGTVVPALATFWKVTRKDGVTLGFTDWSEVVVTHPAVWSTDTDVAPGVGGTVVALASGGSMSPGQSVFSPNGNFEFVFQTDSNLVLLEGSTVLWASGTNGSGATSLIMQSDGNLVLYNSSTAVWSSDTNGKTGAQLVLQNDGNLVIYGVTRYHARSGMTRSAIQERVDLSVPGFEAVGFVRSDDITDEDIRAGRYNGATIKVFMAVPTDPEFATYSTIPLPGYYIGEITLQDGIYTAEIRGIGYALQQTFVELFMPVCTAEFGDSRCKKDLGPLTDTGTVSAVVTPDRLITVSLNSTNAGGRYMFGLVTFNTGRNAGASMEIRNWTGGTGSSGNLLLFMSMNEPVAAGDEFTIVPGCDKSFTKDSGQGCYQWSNTDNFRGFPFIPGMNFLFDYGVATG